MNKLKKSDLIFILGTGVACLITGIIAKIVLQNTPQSMGALSKISFVVASIIAAALVLGITLLKSYFDNKNMNVGTSIIKYIILMVVGTFIFMAVFALSGGKFDTQNGIESILVVIAFVALKIVFDNHFEVRKYDFLSVPFISLFVAVFVLVSFIAICFAKALLWSIIVVVVLRIALGKIYTPSISQNAYQDGYNDAQSNVSPKTYSGDYYRGYQDGSR